jgi:pimeloyl-ACP methyl ester carboxylesterase
VIEHTFDAGPVAITYVAEGREDGRPLVFLHGVSGRWQTWLPVMTCGENIYGGPGGAPPQLARPPAARLRRGDHVAQVAGGARDHASRLVLPVVAVAKQARAAQLVAPPAVVPVLLYRLDECGVPGGPGAAAAALALHRRAVWIGQVLVVGLSR